MAKLHERAALLSWDERRAELDWLVKNNVWAREKRSGEKARDPYAEAMKAAAKVVSLAGRRKKANAACSNCGHQEAA